MGLIGGSRVNERAKPAGGAELAQADGDTHARLIVAAGEVFAAAGYRDATIREICRRAGANVAAVNYHFGDKAGLYRAAIHCAKDWIDARYPVRFELSDDPRKDLGRFIEGFVERILNEQSPSWHWKMMMREMLEPTAVLDEVVDNTIRPTIGFLRTLCGRIMGKPGDVAGEGEFLQSCALSIVSQVLIYRHAKAIMERLRGGAGRTDAAERRRIARHVTVFSLAALDGLRGGPVRRGSVKKAVAAGVSGRRGR